MSALLESPPFTLHAYRAGDLEFRALCGEARDVAVTSSINARTMGVNCRGCLLVMDAEGL